MHPLLSVVIYTGLAGLAMPVGGAIASIERIRPQWLELEFRHGVLAFGGGILVAAVALVLVPEGTKDLSTLAATASLGAGGLVFFLVDRELVRRGRPAANLLAALLDFVPEAVALGALISSNSALGILLALFIGLQNLPEGFNAYRELVVGADTSRTRAFAILIGTGLLGPLCGALGYWVLADMPKATGATMVFAAGGILYLVFQDIAPQARLARHWAPPLGAVAGFAVGLVGTMVTQG